MKHIKLGKAIRYFRDKAELSQQELADKVGVIQPSILNYEKDRAQPPLFRAVLIANVFGITVNDLINKSIELDRQGVSYSDKAPT